MPPDRWRSRAVPVAFGAAASILASALSLPASVAANEALAKAKGCLACHAIDKKAVGPTYKDVAKKYAGQSDAAVKVASAIVKGTPIPKGVGWQKEGKAALPFMSPNATIRPDEAQALAQWILSQK